MRMLMIAKNKPAKFNAGVGVKDASEIPSYAEPFFLGFDSTVEFHPVMLPEDLGRAGLEELGKKWG